MFGKSRTLLSIPFAFPYITRMELPYDLKEFIFAKEVIKYLTKLSSVHMNLENLARVHSLRRC